MLDTLCFLQLSIKYLQTCQVRQAHVVVSVLEEGHVRYFISCCRPFCGVADVVLDEIVSPVDGEGRVALNRHIKLPGSQAWKEKRKKACEIIS